jgi:hypothetical protein
MACKHARPARFPPLLNRRAIVAVSKHGDAALGGLLEGLLVSAKDGSVDRNTGSPFAEAACERRRPWLLKAGPIRRPLAQPALSDAELLLLCCTFDLCCTSWRWRRWRGRRSGLCRRRQMGQRRRCQSRRRRRAWRRERIGMLAGVCHSKEEEERRDVRER